MKVNMALHLWLHLLICIYIYFKLLFLHKAYYCYKSRLLSFEIMENLLLEKGYVSYQAVNRIHFCYQNSINKASAFYCIPFRYLNLQVRTITSSTFSNMGLDLTHMMKFSKHLLKSQDFSKLAYERANCLRNTKYWISLFST